MTQIVTLCDFWDGNELVRLGQVLDVEGAELARYLNTGYVDAHPAAVANARVERPQPLEQIAFEAPDDETGDNNAISK